MLTVKQGVMTEKKEQTIESYPIIISVNALGFSAV